MAAPSTRNRTVGFHNTGAGNQFMGHISIASRAQAGENTTHISSYMLANPSYAKQVYYNSGYDQGNVYVKVGGSGTLSRAAAYSGVVTPSRYRAIETKEQVNARLHKDRHSGLGMGGRHPGGPFGHSDATGFNIKGGRPINPMLRFRRSQTSMRSTGWVGQLTLSAGPNKAFALGGGGRGQSSEDSTKEVYSTIETRMGTRAAFTDESWNEAKGRFGQSWAGYKDLQSTSGSPHLRADLGQMFIRENPNVGFARRVKSGL